MKMLLTLLAALTLALGAGFGSAQEANRFGLFYDEEATVYDQEVSPYTTHTIYLALLNPYNTPEGLAVESVHGYEIGLTVEGPGVVYPPTWSVPALNVGEWDNQIVGFGEGVPVSGPVVILAWMDVLYNTGGDEPLTISLEQASPCSVEGYGSFLAAPHEGPSTGLVPVTSVAGALGEPVVGFNCAVEIDPNRTRDWTMEDIKAMYR